MFLPLHILMCSWLQRFLTVFRFSCNFFLAHFLSSSSLFVIFLFLHQVGIPHRLQVFQSTGFFSGRVRFTGGRSSFSWFCSFRSVFTSWGTVIFSGSVSTVAGTDSSPPNLFPCSASSFDSTLLRWCCPSALIRPLLTRCKFRRPTILHRSSMTSLWLEGPTRSITFCFELCRHFFSWLTLATFRLEKSLPSYCASAERLFFGLFSILHFWLSSWNGPPVFTLWSFLWSK